MLESSKFFEHFPEVRNSSSTRRYQCGVLMRNSCIEYSKFISFCNSHTNCDLVGMENFCKRHYNGLAYGLDLKNLVLISVLNN